MNPHQYSSSNPQNTNPNSQSSNTQFPYPFPNPYFPFPQNTNIDNSQFPNSQNPGYNPQIPNTQFPFPNPFYPYANNSQFPFGSNFSHPNLGNQQTPTNNQSSPHSQNSFFDTTNIIDLNEDVNEIDDPRGGATQWTWTEDKLLISAWLNVSIDPLIGADQKGEAFWDRIRNYCEESNPGLIKRGVIAIKKRWQRINEGAQRYGACYEEAVRKMGSGTNLDNIIAAAHGFHKTKYNKKSNFDKHWNDLKRHPKWRQPKETSIGINSGSAKRSKLSDSGNYSTSMNETPTDENVVESPVRPKGTKAAKRKGKGKAEFNDLKKKEYEEIKASTCRRLDLMAEFNELKKKEEARKENESDMQLLMLDTSIMNEAQREIHAKMIEEVKSRRGWN